MVLTMLLGMVMNVGRQVDGKIRMQNAADAAAYSGGVVLARGMNTLAFTNHLLCDVFALTAFMREARDRNAESLRAGILGGLDRRPARCLSTSGFPKFDALGPAILQKVPLEQQLVDRYSDWAAAVSAEVLPLMEEILAEELIPEVPAGRGRGVSRHRPGGRHGGRPTETASPDYGRGRMLGALWRSYRRAGRRRLRRWTIPRCRWSTRCCGFEPDIDEYRDTARQQRR